MTPPSEAREPTAAQRALWIEEHRVASKELERGLSTTLRTLADVLEEAPEFLEHSPGPGRWSALEILEHVTLANRFLLLLVGKIQDRARKRLEAGRAWPTHAPRQARLAAMARDRSPWPHPEHMTPSGTASRTRIRRRLEEQRDQAVEILRAMPDGQGTLHRVRMSLVHGDDRLDLYEYLEFLGQHAERHGRQVEENRESFTP